MTVENNGVTFADGFQATGVSAGIKATSKPDLALVVNRGPSFSAAAVTTSNRVAAAPVIWTRQAIADGHLKAVVLNSGGANACTGESGFEDSSATAAHAARLLGFTPQDVAVCSTGLIGERLPMEKLLPGLDEAAIKLSADGGMDAATAIMTTDTHPKQASVRVGKAKIGGMAKGAGMLAPGLATMLVVITTDAKISSAELGQALRQASRVTFDRADSDGCMSTNDTVIAMASGACGQAVDFDDFTAGLTQVCDCLARQLIGDAEGASHDISITVTGAASEEDCLEVGRQVARSNLFKCAIFGNDPNWGRVLSAIGVTSAHFNPDEIDVSFNGVMVCRGGQIGDDRNLVDLTPRDCRVLIDLHAGDQSVTILTNDLTYDYVKENAEYSS